MMEILDFLACFAGGCLAVIFDYYLEAYLERRREEWPYVAAFVHPETGVAYSVRKNKHNRYKCYINGVRVSNSRVLGKGNA